MRVKMSDAGARWARDVDIIMAHAVHSDRVAGYALAAVDEARAILAETEPNGIDYGYRRVTDGPACCAGNMALADALRSFVEA